MDKRDISRHTIKRLPEYLQYLRTLKTGTITATAIAKATRLNEVQVRKDIAAVSSISGKPTVGFPVETLIRDMDAFLQAEITEKVILVGAGSLGRALMGYGGFSEYGLAIAAAFDIRTGSPAPLPVYPMEELENVVASLRPRIAILTVPADNAQSVCDRLVACGIQGIWNFTPTFLRVPKGILVQNELLASSAALMVRSLQKSEG